MTSSDPIADMLTRVRNALRAKHQKVDVPASKLKMEIARILKEEGYIINFKLAEDGTQRSIRLYLKYTPGNEPAIAAIERVSRPGCRVFAISGASRRNPSMAGAITRWASRISSSFPRSTTTRLTRLAE